MNRIDVLYHGFVRLNRNVVTLSLLASLSLVGCGTEHARGGHEIKVAGLAPVDRTAECLRYLVQKFDPQLELVYEPRGKVIYIAGSHYTGEELSLEVFKNEVGTIIHVWAVTRKQMWDYTEHAVNCVNGRVDYKQGPPTLVAPH